MAKWPRLSRRRFVALIAALGVAAGAGGVATGVLVFSGDSDLLPGFRLDPDALHYIAGKYFSRYPNERSAEYLEKELLAAVASRSAGGSLAEALATAVRRDFDVGNTVSLDGWILSRTEVRLWLLLALK